VPPGGGAAVPGGGQPFRRDSGWAPCGPRTPPVSRAALRSDHGRRPRLPVPAARRLARSGGPVGPAEVRGNGGGRAGDSLCWLGFSESNKPCSRRGGGEPRHVLQTFCSRASARWPRTSSRLSGGRCRHSEPKRARSSSGQLAASCPACSHPFLFTRG